MRSFASFILGLMFLATSAACSGDQDTAPSKICVAESTRDCVCSDTSSGQQTCSEDGTRYGACICGTMAEDAGAAPVDSGVDSMDAARLPPLDGGNMMRPDRGRTRPPRGDGGMMGGRFDDAGRRLPPVASYTACTGLNEGDDCMFTHPRRGLVTGSCAYRPGETELSCRPIGGRGPGGPGGGN